MKKGERIGLAAAVVIGILCFLVDNKLSQFVASLRGVIPNWFFIGFTFEVQTLVILFFLTSLFLFKEQKRRWIVPLWLTAMAAAVISYAIKIIIMRHRPFEMGIVSVLGIAYGLLEGGFSIWNFSFPSFQAVLAFSALPILDKEFRKFKHVWFVIACLIGFSRVYFGLHYVSDVVLGGAIGYFIGWCFVNLEEEYMFGDRLFKRINRGTNRAIRRAVKVGKDIKKDFCE